MLLMGTSKPSSVRCPYCANVVNIDWKAGVIKKHTIRKAVLDSTPCPGSRSVKVTFKNTAPPKKASRKKTAKKVQPPTKPKRKVGRTWMGEPTNSVDAIPIGLPGLGKRR